MLEVNSPTITEGIQIAQPIRCVAKALIGHLTIIPVLSPYRSRRDLSKPCLSIRPRASQSSQSTQRQVADETWS